MPYSKKSILDSAQRTLQMEADSLMALKPLLGNDFADAVKKIHESKGRLVVTGIGKSAIVANKIVATLNSTGTPSMFMHAADAIHGDLGMVQPEDIIVCISKSGESAEIKVLVPLVKQSGNVLIAIVGNPESFLARNANFVLNATVSQEACPNNLAPTSSTTAQMALGDALAVCLLELNGFSSNDFAKFHPGGALGKKLYLKVSDLYVQHQKPVVKENDSLQKIILEMTSKRLGATAVMNEKNVLSGIITDGDLRRMMEKNFSQDIKAKEIMSRHPKTIDTDSLAVDALQIMRSNKITQLIVMEGKKYLGMVHVHDLLKEGLV